MKNTAITICSRVYDAEQAKDIWNRTVFTACSWHSRQEATVSDRGFHAANTVTVRVFEKLDSFCAENKQAGDGWAVREGDVVVKGIIDGEIEKKSDITSKYTQSFTVTGITDNRRGSEHMQHIRLEGV